MKIIEYKGNKYQLVTHDEMLKRNPLYRYPCSYCDIGVTPGNLCRGDSNLCVGGILKKYKPLILKLKQL